MAHDIQNDRRIDPRIKALLEFVPAIPASTATTREQLLAEATTPEALQGAEDFRQLMAVCDTEEAAPSAGLRVSMESFAPTPGGHTVNLQVIRPVGDEIVACVYYIHGGGMTNLSCFDGMYRGWGKLIAANGVAVVMVDFRNAISPSSVPEVAPYPAGLDDCVAGFHWTVEHASRTGHRPVADRDRRRVRRRQPHAGLRACGCSRGEHRPGEGPLRAVPLHRRRVAPGATSPPRTTTTASSSTCTASRGRWPTASRPSRRRTRWRGRCSPPWTTSPGLPPVVINVNECDPLRDEGIEFYRLLLEAGVPARCRQQMGTMHGTEIFTVACPDVSRDTARDLAAFARD